MIARLTAAIRRRFDAWSAVEQPAETARLARLSDDRVAPANLPAFPRASVWLRHVAEAREAIGRDHKHDGPGFCDDCYEANQRARARAVAVPLALYADPNASGHGQ
jgi:hypothetical protein